MWGLVGSIPSPPRTYYLGTVAFKGALRTYYLGNWGARVCWHHIEKLFLYSPRQAALGVEDLDWKVRQVFKLGCSVAPGKCIYLLGLLVR